MLDQMSKNISPPFKAFFQVNLLQSTVLVQQFNGSPREGETVAIDGPHRYLGAVMLQPPTWHLSPNDQLIAPGVSPRCFASNAREMLLEAAPGGGGIG